jgi:DNA invertase Pin-like site-specific DNA recombinase
MYFGQFELVINLKTAKRSAMRSCRARAARRRGDRIASLLQLTGTFVADSVVKSLRRQIDGTTDRISFVNDRGALIKVLDKPHLDLTTPLGRGFITFLSAMAEDERSRILKRANEGRAAARRKGTRFGRKPKLTAHQQAEALKRLDAGESCRSIAKSMAVHHATISKLAA